jgi:AraC family transcriptional regulator of adaptative response / DNA-3-methyladenine glycosylase II
MWPVPVGGPYYTVLVPFSAVTTTGIYCRPGCGARPRADHVRTYSTASAAEAAGFRACLRCRPYREAGSTPWQAPELVCRAVQLILHGALDGGTEAELGRRVGVSARHLRRMFAEHLGTTPDRFARSRRAHFARRLLDDTELEIVEIAFASGFGSLRQFNRTMQEIFRAAPRELRARRRRADRLVADGGLVLRLPVRAPYDLEAVLTLLARGAVPGVESVEPEGYRRTIAVDGAPGLVEVRAGAEPGHLLLQLHLPYWEGLIHVVERVGAALAVDLELDGVLQQLGADPIVGPLVQARPGVRMPGAWSALEVAAVAAVAEHHCPAVTRELLGRLVRELGEPVAGLGTELTRLFPEAPALARGAARLLPGPAGEVVAALAAAPEALEPGRPLDELLAGLARAGVGGPAAQLVAMRLGHRDACPAELVEHGERLGPARAFAAAHLMLEAARSEVAA